MTTREGAIYDFLSSFGIPAYAATGTPDKAEMPYITYNLVIGDYTNTVSMQVDVWYRTESEAAINAKVREIEDALKAGKGNLVFDEGGIWVTKGNPWCQSVQDEDNTVKRRYINMDLQYLEL